MSDRLPSSDGLGRASYEPTYRAFRLSSKGGIQSAEILKAASDEEAQALARVMVTTYGVELWERGRFLGRYEPHG